ncbi:MAG: phospholipase effector Tle1 domain-containing protein [Chthoniobacterales bacterium]
MDAATSSPHRKRRLVVCLDGTWNRRDDSTNVFHHYTLTFQGIPPNDGGIVQKKYYHRGVGTGVCDRVIGGGFGVGLEGNVRDAYDWLVENYHDDPLEEADEIFVFGFSRGAYTARSLVGFISTFGLLRRGAPLSINELWQDACIIGREREERRGVWDHVFKATPKETRRITQLVSDPWEGSEPRATDLTPKEKLLIRWSRRVRITYLGVYDTVGAMGVDALAIPGLKSKLAMHHNLRATTLVQHCRHALALDEHRSSFARTPFFEYIGHGESTAENRRLVVPNESPVESLQQSAATHWRRADAMWRRKIEQRWFVGAHSNIGGGYPDNELALHPLRWVLEGAREAGLKCEDLPNDPLVTNPLPRDSYTEFVKPFWTQIIRGKRFYRTVDPEPRTYGAASRKKQSDPLAAGFSLQSINEQVDKTVFTCVATHPGDPNDPRYFPPNLFEYASRKLEEDPARHDAADLQTIAARRPTHVWLATMPAYLMMLLWATGAGVGLVALKDIILPQVIAPWLLPAACVTAALFAVIDCLESRVNFSLALGPTNHRRRAALDSMYWWRSFGFILFSLGTLASIGHFWKLGWYAGDFYQALLQTAVFILTSWLIPVAASIGILLANLCDHASVRRHGSAILGALLGFGCALMIALAMVPLGLLFAEVITPAFGRPVPGNSVPAESADRAGLLLLLQLSCLCL